MHLKSIYIKNFRRLRDVCIELEEETSIFVGANNSGKTSATHILQMFLDSSGDKFSIYDFNADCWEKFNSIGTLEQIEDYSTIHFPSISLDLWFHVKEEDLYNAIDLLPSLDWKDTPVGIRLEYAAKSPEELFKNFKAAENEAHENESPGFHPWPDSIVDYLRKNLKNEYAIGYYVLDYKNYFDENGEQKPDYIPLKLGDKDRNGAKIIKSLIKVDFLNAQRHLSDKNSTSRTEDLSNRIKRFYERNIEKGKDDYEALRALKSSENELNKYFSVVFDSLLKSLNKLGYPGLNNPHLVIKCAEHILSQNACVHYTLEEPEQIDNTLYMPDKYNGLGFKNLIYMIIELLDFHSRLIEDQENRAPLHLIVIEEPEVHIHNQIQQVFIRKINEILNDKEPSAVGFHRQLLITTHSPHIIYESGFTPIRYFRRCNGGKCKKTSEVLNLSSFYRVSKDNEDKSDDENKKGTCEFLQKYMKLTHCDLFFADAAILVEGNVERLLLPLMIEKSAPKLQSSYLSILEVGGAFAYRFKELINFLGITTLVITDLDSISTNQVANPEDEEEDDDSNAKKACPAMIADATTSNQTLIQWIPKKTGIAELLKATEEEKIETIETTTVRIAYQTLQKISYNSEEHVLAGRTLEEAFALENIECCQSEGCKDLQLRVVLKSRQLNLLEIYEKIFKRVKSSSFNKTDFALGLMMKDQDDWNVPAYIEEGLLWLEKQIIPEPVEQKIKQELVGVTK